MKKIFVAIVVGLIMTCAVQAQKIDSILRTLDEIFEMKTDIRANVRVTQQKAEQGVKKIEMMYYRRDSDDSFLIVMRAPESDKGNGYLRVGDNFWMYRRNTRTFQHINRDESIGGTDAKGDDFENRKMVDMYKAAVDANGKELISEEMLGKIPVIKFEIIAKVNDVDYPKKVMWVRKDNYLPLKEQAYSASGTLMQTAFYPKYTTVNGRYVAVQHIYVDEFEKGNKTVVEISGIATDGLGNDIFTKAYLENLSK